MPSRSDVTYLREKAAQFRKLARQRETTVAAKMLELVDLAGGKRPELSLLRQTDPTAEESLIGLIQQIANLDLDVIRPQRLEQELGNRSGLRGAREVARRQYDPEIGAQELGLLRQFYPVQAGHHHIGKQHVHMFLGEKPHGLIAVVGR